MFGEAHLNSGRSTEPLIDVFFAPLKGEPERPDEEGCTNYKATRLVRIGVGQLPRVHVGSVWRDGLLRPHRSHRYSTKRFNALSIAPWTTSVIPFGQKLGRWWNTFHLVAEDYKQSKDWSKLSQTNCVAVSSRGCEHKLIIPVVELIRFYHIQTSRLAVIVFTPNIYDLNDICNLEKSKPVRREGDSDANYIHMVHLRQRFYNADAWIIARWVYSEFARRKARQIHTSLMKASNEGRPTFPETSFPFVGKTDLRVSGRWIRGEDRVWRFLVYRILECSGPWEFSDLMVGRDNDGRSDGTPDDDKPTAYPGAQKTPPNEVDEDEGEIRSDEDPDASVGDLEVESVLNNSRFTPFKHKELIRAPKEPTKYRSRKRPMQPDDKPNWSTGPGTWGGTETNPVVLGPGGDEVSEEKEKKETDVEEGNGAGKSERQSVPPLPVSFETIEGVLNMLSDKAYGVTFSFIDPYRRSNHLDAETPQGETESSNTTFFPTVAGGKKRRWSFIKRNPDEIREALIVKLTLAERSYYLFEMSRRPTEEGRYTMALIRKGEGDVLGSYTLDAILQTCVLNRGGWLQDNELSELSRHYLKHTSKDYKQYADRFYNLMIDESMWMG